MIAEEFTFPVITNNNAVNLALLPPLWRIASVNHSDDAESLEQENGRKRKIFASFSSGGIVKIDASENDEKAEAEAEEKMDVLWEGFNEELQSTVDSSSDSAEEAYNREEFEALEGRSNMRELKLVPAKRKKLELVAKMVKKLFLLQNTAAIRKRGLN